MHRPQTSIPLALALGAVALACGGDKAGSGAARATEGGKPFTIAMIAKKQIVTTRPADRLTPMIGTITSQPRYESHACAAPFLKRNRTIAIVPPPITRSAVVRRAKKRKTSLANAADGDMATSRKRSVF